MNQFTEDLLRPIRMNKSFHVWMGLLTAALFVCLYYYYLQLRHGLGVTGLRDYVSWGLYISTFVFFVAASLVGMLIGAVLGLLNQVWAKPLVRMAEIIALAFAMVAGLVIISDMGRPDRLHFVLLFGRVQSPILWDITVVTTYVLISSLLLYIPLIPDLAIVANKKQDLPDWARKLYRMAALGWNGKPEQAAIIHKTTRILLVLIIPVALAIHTVTSWLFAATSRVGWDSTIFGPYFVSGAFVAGCAAVIMAMYFFRNSYKLQKYLTNELFDKMCKLLVLVSLVYLYFNLNEYLVPGYKLKKMEAIHLRALFSGHHAGLFWSTQIMGLALPLILLLFKPMRKPTPAALISVFILVGAWAKRYLIVIPTQEHPFLPIQNVPENFLVYSPTIAEIAITIAPFILVLMIVSVLAKIVPVISIWEMEQHKNGYE